MSEFAVARSSRARLALVDVIAVTWSFLALVVSLGLIGLGLYLLTVSPGTADPAVTVPRRAGAHVPSPACRCALDLSCRFRVGR